MRNNSILKLSAIVFALAGTGAAMAANPLQAYKADPNQVSVSGLSSGGFMAAQLGVAYSSVFTVGFGVFAGGPFDCARNQNYTACMYNGTPTIATPESNMTAWSGSQIDSLANLATRKFYGFVGTQDYIVGVNPMNQLKTQLQAKGITVANTSYVTNGSAAHVFPTDYSGQGDNACNSSSSPYISNCSYDGAGAVLQWMYGTLTARTAPGAQLNGSVVAFDQTPYGGGQNGLDTTGYLYVPLNCGNTSGITCKLHVALHGCVQSYSKVGMSFINNSLYNNWADTNNIIILYPQAIADSNKHDTWDSGSLDNGNGCWDWIGWYGTNADQHGGTHMQAIVNMVNKITSGFSVAIPTTPTGLAVQSTTNTSAALTWNVVSGATSYNVYRGGVKVGSSTTNSYTDSGLTANTTYSYTVTAVNIKGESGQSTAVNATTTNAAVPTAPTGLTSSNITGVSATISWTAVTGATSYSVYRTVATGGGSNSQPIGTTTTTSYNDTGLQAGTTYNYTVAAANANGVGPQSAALAVTTSATGYSATQTNTITNLYSGGYLNVNQYITLGSKYGYNTTITIYNCGGSVGWTNQANCQPMQ
jgi:poly(3-hydroxybutyrate) depolymerase